ncbi:MAG: hypothetical protein RLZZ519_963 [Bacteroidota bacterium]|jgi:hypothetical protein
MPWKKRLWFLKLISLETDFCVELERKSRACPAFLLDLILWNIGYISASEVAVILLRRENDFSMKKLLIQGLPLFAMASLTLGLAPFFPEPHIWEKIRWIATGQKMDLGIYWFDLLLHGSPWVLLITSLTLRMLEKRQSGSAAV